MSTVISFLETMGQDASLRRADPQQAGSILARAGIDPELQKAILAKDLPRMEALLGAVTNVCCILAPTDDEDSEDAPAQDDEEIGTRGALCNASLAA